MSARPRVEIHGHAIVSADDRIADAGGMTPPALRNEADWEIFQAALDAAALTALGRFGHEIHPNARGRRRLVVSGGARGLERRADAWWWNPAEVPWVEVADRLLPNGGILAVPGGQRVFDLFLHIGYDVFHLARAAGERLPDGVRLFSEALAPEGAEAALAAKGLRPGPPRPLPGPGPVTLTRWAK